MTLPNLHSQRKPMCSRAALLADVVVASAAGDERKGNKKDGRDRTRMMVMRLFRGRNNRRSVDGCGEPWLPEKCVSRIIIVHANPKLSD